MPVKGVKVKQSLSIRRLERHARKLLAEIGNFTNEYDSARIGSALGFVSKAVDDLKHAAIVLEAREKAGEI